MKIEMLIKPPRLPCTVKCRGADYVFDQSRTGAVVAEVGDEKAVAMFLARSEAYRPAAGSILPPALAVRGLMADYRTPPAISEDGVVLVSTVDDDDDGHEGEDDDFNEPDPPPPPTKQRRWKAPVSHTVG